MNICHRKWLDSYFNYGVTLVQFDGIQYSDIQNKLNSEWIIVFHIAV